MRPSCSLEGQVPRHGAWPRSALCALAVMGLPVAAWAGPTGSSVVAGQASITSPSAQSTIINQTTSKVIIDWSSFSIGSGQSVAFRQPNSASIALNRVLGNAPSSIYGSLTANGQVWLVNPNGVFFGAGAQVNVGGLLATTADISNADFLAGTYNFATPSPNQNAGIVNLGAITAAQGGSVVLSAPYVENGGTISALLGTVAIGGAKTFAVDFNGDNLLSFAVTGAVTQAPVGPDGRTVDALVTNTGTLSADGGRVLVSARAAGNIVDNVINTSGIVEANSVSMMNGTVVLDAGDGGLAVSGKVSAAGAGAGETGGTIEALGGTVALTSTAALDASGQSGGGTIMVGGNFHGAGPQQNATNTSVAQGAVINASATTSGNGGWVVVWSNVNTVFDGSIYAAGGALGGNGGYVETSGRQYLSVQTGFVDTLAPHGTVGTWLMDPANINIATGGSTTPITSDPFANNAGNTDTIDPTAIEGAASNVSLQATNNITFSNAVAMTNTGVGITAQAGNDITVASGATITTKGGALNFTANDNSDSEASGAGGISIAAALSTAGGGATGGAVALTVNGASTGNLQLGANVTTAGGAVTLTGPIELTTNVALDTTNGGLTAAGATVTFAGTLDGLTSRADNLTISAGTAGNVDFTQRVGTDNASIGTDPGAVSITSADVVNMTIPYGSNGDGFSVASLTIAGPGNTAGAASLNAQTYISTSGPGNAGNIVIRTVGDVAVADDIFAAGGVNGNTGGNGGNVTIVAGGSVAIETCCTLAQLGYTGSGDTLNPDPDAWSINTVGYFPATSSQTAGNGGTVSVTGTSINLPFGVTTNGGSAVVAASTANGGNGGSITLTATAGTVTIGSEVGAGLVGYTGNATGLISVGGNSEGGSGGSGGAVTVSGTSLSISKIYSQGGSTSASSGVTGGDGGAITLIATATSGPAVTLWGDSESVSTTTPGLATLDANGGRIGVTFVDAPFFFTGGSYDGTAGNITIGSTSGGAALLGTSYIQLESSIASGATYNGGPNIQIFDSGTIGGGGTILLNGPIEATTANVESLRLSAGNGTTTIGGAVGDLVPVNTIVLSCCGLTGDTPNPDALPAGSKNVVATFDAPVTVETAFLSQGTEAGGGGVTFEGLLTTPLLSMVDNTSSLSILGGATFSGDLDTGGAPLTIAGTLTFTSTFTGNLTHGNPATLAGPTILDSTALNIPVTFDAAVNGTGAGGQSLTIEAGTGTITINAPLGGTVPLGAVTLDSSGGVILDSNITTKGGAVTLNGPTVLQTSVTIDTTDGGAAPTGGTVTFAGTLDGAVAGVDNLTIAAGSAGNVNFEQRVGTDNAQIGTDPGAVSITSADAVNMTMPVGTNGDGFSVASLSIAGPGNTAGAASLNAQSYISTFNPNGNGGAVTILTSGAVSVGANIVTMGGVAGNTGGDGGAVTINAGGSVTIDNCCNLSQQGTIIGSGDTEYTSTSGIITYGFFAQTAAQTAGNGGAVSITGTSINLPLGVLSVGGAALAAGSTANGGNGGAITLTATAGGVSIGGPASGNLIGAFANGGASEGGTGGHGGNVTISGTTISTPIITTFGGDSLAASGGTGDYGGNITLIATATNGAAVTLYGESDSAASTAPGLVTLDADGGRFGATVGLAPVFLTGGTITGAAGNITIEGSSGGAALQGTSYIQLATSAASAYNGGSVVFVTSSGGLGGGGTILFNGPVEATTANVESLRLAAANGTVTVGGAIGDVTPLFGLVLGCCGAGNPDFLPAGSSGGVVTLQGPVTVGHGIGDLATSGNLIFDGLITTPLLEVTAGTTNLTMDGGAVFSGSLSTPVGESITLAGTFTFTDTFTGNGGIPTVTLSGPTTFDFSALNNPVTLNGPINGSGAGGQSLTVDAGTSSIAVDAQLGGTVPLGAVTLNGSGGVILDGNITTKGGLVTLNGPTTLAANVTIATSNGGVDFTNTVDDTTANTDTLTVNAGTGPVTFSGAVGGSAPLASLSVTGGTIALDGNVTTGAGQTYTGATTVGNDTLTTTNAAVAFTGSIDGATVNADTLTIAAGTGAVTLGGAIGSNTTLSALNVTSGAITLDGNVTTQGGQTYTGPVTLGANATLTSTGDGALTFGSTLTGGGFNLGLIDDQAPSFGSTISGLGNVTMAPYTSGDTVAVGASSLTLSDVTYDFNPDSSNHLNNLYGSGAVSGTVTIGSATTGTVTLQAFNDGTPTMNLALVSGGSAATEVTAAYAGTGSLALTSGSGGISLQAGVTTTGTQSYNSPVTLAANTSLAGSTVTFGSTVDAATAGSQSLIVTGNAAFDGAVGTTALAALTVTGTTDLNGGTVKTTGAQDYESAVSLTADATLTSSAGAITFGSTVDGAHTLSATASGLLSVDGAVGGTTPLTGLSLGGSTVDLGGNITTNGGGVTVTGPTTLQADVAIDTTDGGTAADGANVTFTGTVDGAQALTVTAGAATATFDAGVGGNQAVTTLSVTAGSIVTNGVVSTVAQEYFGPLTTNGTYNAEGGSGRLTAPVTLAGDTTLIGTGGAQLNVTVNGSGAGGQTLTIEEGSAPVTVDATLGGTVPLGAVTLVGGSITLNATITTKGEAVNLQTSGAVTGSLDLTAGSGPLDVTAASAVLTSSVIDGASGGSAAADVQATPTEGAPGPFTTNGVPDGTSPAPPPPPATTPGTSTGAAVASLIQASTAATSITSTTTSPTPSPTAPPAVIVTQTSAGTSPSTTSQTSSADAVTAVAVSDTGAAMFSSISPVSTGAAPPAASQADDTWSETLTAIADPAPVTPASHAVPVPPKVTQSIAAHLDRLAQPTVPSSGVSGIQFFYSSSGNSALW